MKVQTKGSVQSVTTSITNITSPIPDVTNVTVMTHISDLSFWMELASISYATREFLLGNKTGHEIAGGSETTQGYDPAISDIGQPSFLQTPGNQSFVMQGIEEMSYNITAALLTLQLENMTSECFLDQVVLAVYQYSSRELWIPYGLSDFSLLLFYDLTFSSLFYRWLWALL